MAFTKSINKYQIYLSSHPQFNEWQANIILRMDNTLVVDLRFVADPASLVNIGYANETGVSLIYVGIERLAWFVDVLRHEKPLFLTFYPKSGTTPARMLLQTSSDEPVGEQEGV
ncbi:MAG TPA: hypothetical protein VF297_08390 [Pyrinomonadaceae bacterium]